MTNADSRMHLEHTHDSMSETSGGNAQVAATFEVLGSSNSRVRDLANKFEGAQFLQDFVSYLMAQDQGSSGREERLVRGIFEKFGNGCPDVETLQEYFRSVSEGRCFSEMDEGERIGALSRLERSSPDEFQQRARECYFRIVQAVIETVYGP